jgi:hypothetical protein
MANQPKPIDDGGPVYPGKRYDKDASGKSIEIPHAG